MSDCSLLSLSSDLAIVYWVSLGVFGLATLVALGLYFCYDRCNEARNAAMIASIVFMFQVFLYTGLLLGQGASLIPDVGSCQPWARWLTYTFSCALLAYEIAGLAGLDTMDILFYVATISLTLITGFFAAVGSEIDDRWVWFGVGFIPYFVSFVILFRRARGPLIAFVSITWSLYPLILVLGPLYFGVISLTIESALYLVADLITKIGFEFWLIWRENSQYKSMEYYE